MNNIKTILFERLNLLDRWIKENRWKAYDPFDGMSSRFLNSLTFNNHYLRIAVQQTIRRFPLNLRPLFGIRPETSSKGMGFCALGYLKLYQTTHSADYLAKMRYCLDWLENNYNKGYAGFAWGNHFRYESRGGALPMGVPTVVWTSLIANVFLDAYEETGENGYFKVAQSAANFIVNDIGRYEEDGKLCFMYTPLTGENGTYQGCIHNSNVLCAWLLARIYKHTREESFFALAGRSVSYTVKHQRHDGSWYYGEPQKYHWIDSFHTGYVLESIYGYIKATGDTAMEDVLIKGYQYFKSTFFKKDGTPRYYNYKTYPIDIQCASQGIQTLVRLRDYDDDSIDLAKKVAQWTIFNMGDPDGYFYFRKYPVLTNKTPMFHWGQATMLSSLAHLFVNL